jgi:hypothetical protein
MPEWIGARDLQICHALEDPEHKRAPLAAACLLPANTGESPQPHGSAQLPVFFQGCCLHKGGNKFRCWLAWAVFSSAQIV